MILIDCDPTVVLLLSGDGLLLSVGQTLMCLLLIAVLPVRLLMLPVLLM